MAVCVGATALAVSGGCRPERPVGAPVPPRMLSFVANPSVRILAEYVCGARGVPELQLADNSADFASVWRAFELTGPAPPVDFSSWLVLGFSELDDGRMTPAEGGWHCQIDGFALSADRILVPTCRSVGNFIVDAAAVRNSGLLCKHVLVVGIARGALPEGELALGLRILEEPYLELHRFMAAPPSPIATPKTTPPVSVTRRDVAPARDEVTSEVALPAPGDVCLAELAGGVRAWVVRHVDQSVSVVAGDYRTQPVDARLSRGAGMRRRGRSEVNNGIWGVSLPTRWDSAARTFSNLFDEYGSPIIATLDPLDQYAFRSADSSPDSIGIGKRIKGMARVSVAEDGAWPSLFPDGIPAYAIEDYRFVVPAEVDTGSEGLRAVWGDLAGDAHGNVRLCDAFEPSSDSESVGRSQGRNWIFRAPPCFERLRPRWLSYRPILPAPESGPTLPTYAGPFLVELRKGSVVRLISLMQDRRFLAAPALRSASRSVIHCR